MSELLVTNCIGTFILHHKKIVDKRLFKTPEEFDNEKIVSEHEKQMLQKYPAAKKAEEEKQNQLAQQKAREKLVADSIAQAKLDTSKKAAEERARLDAETKLRDKQRQDSIAQAVLAKKPITIFMMGTASQAYFPFRDYLYSSLLVTSFTLSTLGA